MFGINSNIYYVCDNFKQVGFSIIIVSIENSYKMKLD